MAGEQRRGLVCRRWSPFTSFIGKSWRLFSTVGEFSFSDVAPSRLQAYEFASQHAPCPSPTSSDGSARILPGKQPSDHSLCHTCRNLKMSWVIPRPHVCIKWLLFARSSWLSVADDIPSSLTVRHLCHLLVSPVTVSHGTSRHDHTATLQGALRDRVDPSSGSRRV